MHTGRRPRTIVRLPPGRRKTAKASPKMWCAQCQLREVSRRGLRFVSLTRFQDSPQVHFGMRAGLRAISTSTGTWMTYGPHH